MRLAGMRISSSGASSLLPLAFWYNCRMRLRYLIFAAFFALAMPVFAIDVGKLPPPQYLDTEVTAHYGLAGFDNAHFWGFSLHFNGTPSNNVEVAFGTDADSDGKLSLDETDMVIGWDCGSFFAENFSTCEAFVERNVGSDCIEQSLFCHFQVNADRQTLKTFTATNGHGVAFADISEAKPNWLYRRNWNLMRLTARGVDVQNESFGITVRRRRLEIFLK